jgi:hypothetical protein
MDDWPSKDEKFKTRFDSQIIGDTNQEAQDVGSNRSFWMVYVAGMDAPGIRHEAKVSAVKEAERLATKTKKTVYLMRAVEGFRLQEIPVVKFNLG